METHCHGVTGIGFSSGSRKGGEGVGEKDGGLNYDVDFFQSIYFDS